MAANETISELRVAVLKAIGLEKGARYTSQEIRQRMSPKFAEQGIKNVHNMVSSGLLTQHRDQTPNTYGLSDLGRAILLNIDNYNVVDASLGKRRPRKPAVEPEPQQMQFNISPTASTLADHVSAVIAENEQYRNLLLQIHQTVGHALGLNKS